MAFAQTKANRYIYRIFYFILYNELGTKDSFYKKISWINKDKNNTFEFLSFEFVKYK